MGIVAARPYIIDEFLSDDEEAYYESALEFATDVPLLNEVSPVEKTDDGAVSTQEELVDQKYAEGRQTEKPLASINSHTPFNGLNELLKLIESQDFEEAQKVADLLRRSEAFSNNCSSHTISVPQSITSSESYTETSTWPSKTHDEELADKLSCISQQQNDAAGDFNDKDQRKALAQLDKELSQFEADEHKIASEMPIYHSCIPRLKSSPLRPGRNAEIHNDFSKRTQVERRRSPSPSASRPSAIPRYSWAQVTPIIGRSSSVESKTEGKTLDTSCLSSQTLDSLLEISDKRHSNVKKYSPSSERSERCQCARTNEPPGNTPSGDINMSDQTGRVRLKKKHSGLPFTWTKPEGNQNSLKAQILNESHMGFSTTSASSGMATDELAACKTIGEYGDLAERKVLDLRRWYSISRPQYKSSCGISAIVSCWNYLYSTIGHGSLKPLTQENAMNLLGFTPPFDSINFAPVTGNVTLLRWFIKLNTHFRVNGRCFIMYKTSGKNQTVGVTSQMALSSLKRGLKDPNTSFIYHCHNHYFCPIGYEDTSQLCVDAYKNNIGEDHVDTWMLIGDTSRKHPAIHCKSWDQICIDLNCKSPTYLDIRQNWKGVMRRQNITTMDENLHCIIAFQKVIESGPNSPTPESSSASSCSNLSTARLSQLSFRQNNCSSMVNPSPGTRSVVDDSRPELTNYLSAGLEDEEVGCENLDSDNSDDDINYSGNSTKKDKITNEVEKTKEGEMTGEGKVAKEGETTKAVETTAEVETNNEVQMTAEGEMTGEAEMTKAVETTDESETTDEGEMTEEAEPTKVVEMTEESETTDEGEMTEEAEPIKAVEATEENETTDEGEMTEEAELTKAVDTAHEFEMTE